VLSNISAQDREIKRNIPPDGYIMLTTEEHHLRYLLEIDRSTGCIAE